MENLVYIFPLQQSVLFNKVTLPFHIFEPRYIKMVEDSIEKEIPIAVVPYHPSDFYRGEICIAGLPHIISSYPDGKLDIYITGEVKCRIRDFIKNDPYHIYSYKEIYEDVLWDENLEMEIDSLRMILENWANHYLPDEIQKEAFSNTLEDPEVLINYCAVFLVNNLELRRDVMKAATLREKVGFLLQAVGPREVSLGPFMPTLRF